MAFSEKIKERVKRKAFFRCVICQEEFVEVHHIVPQEEGGADTEENAAPLCARCHDLYGGNPNKRKQIRQMRDYWYETVENMTSRNIHDFEPIKPDYNNINSLKSKKVSISHVVFANETFPMAARTLYKLIYTAQQNMPNQSRVLYLDIEGHRNQAGGFDHDMLELQMNFMFDMIMPYLSEVHMPLGEFENKKLQRNDMPEELGIYSFDD